MIDNPIQYLDFIKIIIEIIVSQGLKSLKEIETIKKIKDSEEKLKFYSENSPMGIIEWDSEFRIIQWSDHAKKILGWSSEEMIGKNVNDLDLVYEPDVPIVEKTMERLLNGLSLNVVSTNRNYKKDRSIITCEWYNTILKDENGKMISLLSQFFDITERQQVDQELKESEEKYRLLYTSIDQGMALHEIITDSDGKVVDYLFLDINDSYTNLVGYTREMCVGRRVRELMPEVEQYWIDTFGEVALTGKPHYYENFSESLGKYFSTYTYSPKKNQFAVLVNDITGRKESEKKLKESELKYRSLIESSSDAIFCVDEKGQYQFTNQLFASTFGKTPAFFIGKTFWDVYDKEHADMRFEAVKRVFETGESESLEVEVPLPDRTLYFWATTNPIKDESGKVILNLTHSTDITELKNIQRDLAESDQFNSQIINSVQEGIIIYDHNLRYQVWNTFMENLSGIPASDAIGKHPSELFPFLEEAGVIKNIERALNGEFVDAVDFPFFSPYSGKSGWTSDKNLPFRDANGNIIGVISTVHDITNRRKAEEELHNSYVFNETLLKTIPFGMDIVNESGTVLFQSDNFKKIFGADAISHKCWELYRDDRTQCHDCPLADGINIGETKVYESHGVLGNRIFEINHTGMMYQGKKAMLEIFQDITFRKEYEEALERAKKLAEENSAFLKAAMSNSHAGIAIAEVPSGKLRYVNRAALMIQDKDFDETMNDPEFEKYFASWEHLHFDGTPLNKDEVPLARAILYGETNSSEFIVRRDKNDDRYVWANAGPILNEKGIQIAAIVVFLDITYQKLAEFALKKSEKEFRNLAESMPQIVWTAYDKGLANYFNQHWTDYTGLTLSESYGNGWIVPFHPDDKEVVWYQWQEAVKSNTGYSLECRLRRFDGTFQWWLFRGVPQKDESGKTVKWFCTCTDIEELKKSEVELKERFSEIELINKKLSETNAELSIAKEKAEESDRLKSVFLTNMSHEIRTPMNGILGFTELLKGPNLSNDELIDYIQTIQISSDRLLNTINDIIDISKIESGLMKVDLGEINIHEKINFIFKFLKPEVDAKGLQFLFKYSLPFDGIRIKTDFEKVYSVLTNLIKNAIKFTDEGLIEFGYIKKGSFLEFFVRDTGIGIPENQKTLIFERFRQGSESHDRKFEGSGLGLAISKSYVEMLGGKIWVESQEGKGSIFYFTIPTIELSNGRARSEKELVEIDQEVKMKKLKILIAEDDAISQNLLTRTLQKISKEILHASTGVEAVEACQNNPDLDLVLMDIRMSELGGLEATRQIRQFNNDIVIIAQTAFGFSSDYDEAIKAGCTDYISKPVRINTLYDLIKQHCNK